MDFSEFDRGAFVVNILGIVLDPATKKILIGKRVNDPYIKKLSWCFPGGRPSYGADLEKEIVLEIKRKTGINVGTPSILFAKTYPEDQRFLSIYYLCEAKNTATTPAESFVELKWVNPSDAGSYFTTSLHPKLLGYLKKL